MVKTNLGGGVEVPGSVTTDVAVKGMLKHIGKESVTNGCTAHAIGQTITEWTPWFLTQKFMFSTFVASHKKAQLEGKADIKQQ